MITIYGDGPLTSECYVVVLQHRGALHVTDFSEYGIHVLAGLGRMGALCVMTSTVPVALAGREREPLHWLGTGHTRNRHFGGDFARADVIPGRTGNATVADLMAAL